MTDIQIFNHEDFGNVRVIGDFDNPLFCLADVCKILALDSSQVMKRLDDGVVSIHPIKDALGRIQNANFVNEDGLYDVILDSRKPEAKRFRKWITSVVLPSIRKHGVYMTPEAAEKILHNPDFIIKLAQQLKDAYTERDKLQGEVVLLQPKADYCDKVLQCEDLLRVTDIAKDYGMTAKKFNKLLEEQAVQYKLGKTWFLRANFAKLGWAQSKTQIFDGKDGSPHSVTQLYWTQNGRKALYDFLKERGIVPTIERDPYVTSLS